MGKFVDLTGQRFGKLVVVERAENYISPKGQLQTQWLCKCDCGNSKIISQSSLKKGVSQSCGCIRKEINKAHGLSHTRIYNIWNGMKRRCIDAKQNKYYLYGGRGITVCDEWLNDFQAFYEWAMANGYADDLTIDRQDSDKGYSPDNCKWATYKEQNNHLKRNHLITYNGKTQTMKQWAEETHIPYQTLAKRINKLGWSIERALTTI